MKIKILVQVVSLLLTFPLSLITCSLGEDNSTPEPPVNLAINSEKNIGITLTWDAVAGAESYKVYRSTSLTGEYTSQAENLKTNIYTQSNITNQILIMERVYYYYVTAVGKNEKESLPSEKVSAAAPDFSPGFSPLYAIEIPFGNSGIEGNLETPEMWYYFERIGNGLFYGYDRAFSNSYTGHIVVDVLNENQQEIYLGGVKLTGIDIGRGGNTLQNVQNAHYLYVNWNGKYYVKVRPQYNNIQNCGTFKMFLTDPNS